jgi:hypothetical protein
MSEPASESPHRAFDGQGLLRQVGGDHALFGAVLEAFRQEWPRRAADATKALATCDSDAARRALHALTGMLMQLEAPAGLAVGSVERLVKHGDVDRAREAWPGAARELELLDRDVSELLERT